jgi:hypothetical protein
MVYDCLFDYWSILSPEVTGWNEIKRSFGLKDCSRHKPTKNPHIPVCGFLLRAGKDFISPPSSSIPGTKLPACGYLETPPLLLHV